MVNDWYVYVCVFVLSVWWMIYVLIRFLGILTNVEGKSLHFSGKIRHPLASNSYPNVFGEKIDVH